MSFESELFSEVDDARHIKPYDSATGISVSGYKPRNYGALPQASIVGTSPFPKELLIPRDQWKERIEEKQKKGIRGVDLIRRIVGARWLNQDPTNYCWMYATTQLIMAMRGIMGLPFKRLSPYSAGCIIDSGQNNGGWGTEGLEFIIQNGIASEEFWPQGNLGSDNAKLNNAAIRNWRQYVDGSRADAAQNKVTEWWDLEPRNLDEKMSCLLQPDIPIFVSTGYNYEGHQTYSVDGIWTSKDGYGVTDMDSYTQDGSPMFRNRSERYAAGDDAVAPRVVTPS